jgi:hypothetical protein
MNQEKTGHIRGFPVAIIRGAVPDKLSPALALQAGHQVLELRQVGDQSVLFATDWEGATWLQRIDLLHGVLAILTFVPPGPDVELHWLFSRINIHSSEAATLLAQWNEEGAPVLKLINFIIEKQVVGRCVMTRGLAAIVGHEIDTLVLPESGPELALMVGRLAEEALRSGPIESRFVVGGDSRGYDLLTISKKAIDPPVVRISEQIQSDSD